MSWEEFFILALIAITILIIWISIYVMGEIKSLYTLLKKQQKINSYVIEMLKLNRSSIDLIVKEEKRRQDER